MLNKLKKLYKQSLHEKIDAIKAHLRERRAGDKSAEKKLRIIAHSLHDSGTTCDRPWVELSPCCSTTAVMNGKTPAPGKT